MFYQNKFNKINKTDLKKRYTLEVLSKHKGVSMFYQNKFNKINKTDQGTNQQGIDQGIDL